MVCRWRVSKRRETHAEVLSSLIPPLEEASARWQVRAPGGPLRPTIGRTGRILVRFHLKCHARLVWAAWGELLVRGRDAVLGFKCRSGPRYTPGRNYQPNLSFPQVPRSASPRLHFNFNFTFPLLRLSFADPFASILFRTSICSCNTLGNVEQPARYELSAFRQPFCFVSSLRRRERTRFDAASWVRPLGFAPT